MPLTATLNLFRPKRGGITNTLTCSHRDAQLRQNPNFRGFISNYVIYLVMLVNEPKINYTPACLFS